MWQVICQTRRAVTVGLFFGLCSPPKTETETRWLEALRDRAASWAPLVTWGWSGTVLQAVQEQDRAGSAELAGRRLPPGWSQCWSVLCWQRSCGTTWPATGVECRSSATPCRRSHSSSACLSEGLGDHVGTDERVVTDCLLERAETLGVCCL